MRTLVWLMVVCIFGAAGCEIFNLPIEEYPASPECGGEQTVSPPADLARWPVLQSVTPTEATVVWGVRNDAPASLGAGRGYARAVSAVDIGAITVDDAPLRLVAARLTGLLPATRYCYEVAAGGRALAAGFVLQTAPAVTTSAVRFHALGDYGSGAWAQRRVRAQMEKIPADFLITTGDNAYPDGTFAQFEANVFAVYRTMFARMPVFPTPGNHDYRTEAARPYLTEFVLPENAWRAADRERYYSFDWGPVHFVALDTERPLKEVSAATDDDEADWLDADLAKTRAPWTIAFLHRPPYTASENHAGDPDVQNTLVPLFEKHGVKLVLAGHNHVYERFRPKEGVTYVTTGGGGRYAYRTGESPDLAVTQDDYHFMTFTVDACVIEGRAINAGGDEIDRFSLRRCGQ